jgi:uncharacterized protein (DUF1697 family)
VPGIDGRARTRIALLRGVNVGKARRIAMADLRSHFEGLGYGDVRTLLASGNVVFTVRAGEQGDVASRVQEAMERRLKVSARVLVLTAAQLDAAVAGNPLRAVAKDPSRFLLTFFADPADRRRLLPLARQAWKPEAFAVGAGVAYLWCAGGILESPVNHAVGRVLGDGGTSRNWATVLKLAALAGAGET